MGNQLISSVKTVIRPIDYYLNEVPNLKFKSSLGQTQFLKVAVCNHNEGDVVVKVLPHEDPSLLLEGFRKEILELSKISKENISIAAFHIVEIKTNFAYMVRQYIRYSLYDRLSTRPFLTDLEKSWIVYQIFRCMEWCHNRNIYHGDLKLENILITSNLWVVIADYASYKPIYLPEDNPTFFNYFFDTSRRRCCNIAPERFASSDFNPLENEGGMASSFIQTPYFFNSLYINEGKLTPEMDMFSLGCILAEIYSESLFDLSRLLNYKDNPDQIITGDELSRIRDNNIRDVVTSLISVAPEDRKTCTDVLEMLKGNFFPNFFDDLYSFMEILNRMPPDHKITYLHRYKEYLIDMMLKENPKGILILLITVTSTIRGTKHVSPKLWAQELMHYMAKSSPELEPYIIDRLIPYLVWCLEEQEPRVRGEAINSISKLLELVHTLPPSDSNIFSDYLMEKIQKMIANEKSVYVRLCTAKNIGRLSMIALNFLHQYCDSNYSEELQLLHKYFENLISFLITDVSNCVRRFIFPDAESCSKLCSFFGYQKTISVLLSHIITFLNDKSDFHLRLSFFDNIIVIMSYLGIHFSEILHPLLQQGLYDPEEFVTFKAIESICFLVEHSLLNKKVIQSLFSEILPLIFHPNQFIQNEVKHLIMKIKESSMIPELNIRFLPILCQTFESNESPNCYSILIYERSSFNRPLPRNIYDTIFMAKDFEILNNFFETLQQKNDGAAVCIKGNQIYRRLLAENITPIMEKQILKLKDYFQKVYLNRRNIIGKQNTNEYTNYIQRKKYDKIRTKEINLASGFDQSNMEDSSNANQEWMHMFGPNSNDNNSVMISSENNNSSKAMVKVISSTSQISTPFVQQTVIQESSQINSSGKLPIGMEEIINDMKNFMFLECPPYIPEIRKLEQHKKNSFMPISPLNVNYSKPIRPRGYMVAHLYEHKASVNQLARFGRTNIFLSCSDDGSIRLWDICNDPAKYIISQSKFQFCMDFTNGSPVNFKGIINCGQFLIAYSQDSQIHVFEVADSQLIMTCSFSLAFTSHSGIPFVITSICSLSENTFAVSISNSTIYVYDTRNFYTVFFNVPVMKMATPPGQRAITSIDGDSLVLFAGTASGYINGFDLRCNLKVLTYVYSTKDITRIAKIKYTPFGLLSSTYGNHDVTLWDFKLSQKSKILSCSKSQTTQTPTTTPTSENENEHNYSVTKAILPILINSSHMPVITGGSDMRIRYWDMEEPEHSYIISDPQFKSCNYCFINKRPPSSVSTCSRPNKMSMGSASKPVVSCNNDNTRNNNSNIGKSLATFKRLTQKDGIVIIQETENSSYSTYVQSIHSCPYDQQIRPFSHQDTIMDIINMDNHLISAGRDGSVKVWK